MPTNTLEQKIIIKSDKILLGNRRHAVSGSLVEAQPTNKQNIIISKSQRNPMNELEKNHFQKQLQHFKVAQVEIAVNIL